ncbi:unnamed protein product [Anisakis simplex]|uniref:E3 SUMO-protein ligase NSE2 n=1 Tax=Anisakis simplex TaxID=6269 RepID=A0A0M3K5V1_ANISI|nr:unnamed protein product [Anisakis simplex]
MDVEGIDVENNDLDEELNDIRQKYLENAISHLKSLGDYREHIGEEVFKDMIDRCEALDRKLQNEHRALRDALKPLEKGRSADIETVFKQRLAKLEQSSANKKRIEIYEELRCGDEVLQVEQVINSKLDPYTNKAIVNPVRNKRCGHVYDAAGAKAFLVAAKKGSRCPCPVRSCKVEDVRKEDIEPYPEFFDHMKEMTSID